MDREEARKLTMRLALAGDDVREIKDVIEQLIWALVEDSE